MGCDFINVYQVYQKYNKDFIVFAKSITQNQDRAFDLIQDAYVILFLRKKCGGKYVYI